MANVFYRLYRPQTFTDIVGQTYIKTILQNELAGDTLAHAYLFCGPRAVGKTTMARVLAKALNCQTRKTNTSEPCNTCQACLSINNNNNFDVLEIDAASNTGVDNVRENIIAASRVAPAGKYKIFIIDEVHMLSISAFNALLKALEEPPANIVFILCTTEIHKVPATIISRCQRFDFKHIGVSDIIKKLNQIALAEKLQIDPEVIENIARHAGGHLRDAESILNQIVSIAGHKITLQEAELVIPKSDLNEVLTLIEALNIKDATQGIRIINDLATGGFNLKQFIEDLIEILRKIMLVKISPALAENLMLDFGENIEQRIAQSAMQLNLSEVINMMERFGVAALEIKTSFIVQLPLEMAIIELCQGNPPTIKTPKVTVNSKQIITEPATKINTSNPSKINLEIIMNKWDEFLLAAKNRNHSLAFVLQGSELRELSDNTIDLAFKYKFHKDRVMSSAVRAEIETILQTIYQQPLKINAILDEHMVTQKKEQSIEQNDSLVNNLLEAFGGEVI